MVEERADKMANILNLCESNPDASLELLDKVIKDNTEFKSDPFIYFAKAMAYGSKGFFQLWKSKQQINFLNFDKEQLREILGVTNDHLDCLAKGLQALRQMEENRPGYLDLLEIEGKTVVESKIDGMSMVLERCRPGSVQGILGKTKIKYFGPYQIGIDGKCNCSQQELNIFCNMYFSADRIAKSAYFMGDGKNEAGDRYVVVKLKTSLNALIEPSAEFPVAGFIYLCTDGICKYYDDPG
jgi:hypothetical protein